MREDDRGAHGVDPGGVTSGRGILLIVAALLPFAALTLAALGEGPGAFPRAITHSWASLQIFLDLVLGVLVFCFWIHRDATLAGAPRTRLTARGWWSSPRRGERFARA